MLIDGHGLAFRGFYALPESLTANDGTPTNAIVGFTNMLFKCEDTLGMDSIAIFFDPKGPTKRHEIYKEYKDGRKPTPESFKIQLPIIIELCKMMGYPVLIKDGIEADDNIISTALYLSENDFEVTILTADKDILQVVSDNIKVMRPTKGVSEFKNYDKDSFVKEYNFQPAQMAEYLSIMGDTVDNIPGVKGIGEKGARELVSQYGTLENIYEKLDELSKGKREKLLSGRDSAFKSRELIVPILIEPVRLEELKRKSPLVDQIKDLCQSLGLKKVLYRFAEIKEEKQRDKTKIGVSTVKNKINNLDKFDVDFTPVVKQKIPFLDVIKEKELSYGRVISADGNEQHVYVTSRNEYCILDTDNNDEVKKLSEWCKNGILYVFGFRKNILNNKISMPDDSRIKDVEIAHYLLHPDRGGNAIIKTMENFPKDDFELLFHLVGLWNFLYPEIIERGLSKLMYEIDVPLSRVLASVQENGFNVDIEKLTNLEKELKNRIEIIEKEISDIAGESINLNSPKQVSVLLFEKLHLPTIKKTSTGFSTDMSVLEDLSRLPEPLSLVPHKLIEYRETSKILTGFVHPFINIVNNGECVIHSTFDHLSTGTGRLSSRDPNVQNLPVFGEWAVKFRECLIPLEGNVFVAADYSQIELRVLAHYSNEEKLLSAFKMNNDVHSETASWVFGLSPKDISMEQRRFAKVVNFGLLYGMSAHGLAQKLGITRIAASKIVEKYFNALPKVKLYLKNSIENAKRNGYTESIFGRIRPLNELSTIGGRGNNPIDRVAVNSPIQSTASDIAKISLIKFYNELTKSKINAKIVLQVHDSIVCECKEDQLNEVRGLLVKTMEGVNVLSVPLKVETKVGFSLNEV
ncbi:MAG: DNA polymerase I [Synergistaceae bacterium]